MQLKTRVLALPLAAILASGALFSTTPAQARPRSKDYKTGAIVLGAVGAYFLSRGKTVEGAALLGGGVLAYNKSRQLHKKERYGSYFNPRYASGGYRNDSGGYRNGSGGNFNDSTGNFNDSAGYRNDSDRQRNDSGGYRNDSDSQWNRSDNGNGTNDYQFNDTSGNNLDNRDNRRNSDENDRTDGGNCNR